MFRRKEESAGEAWLPVPAKLPPAEGLDENDEYAPGRRPRTWLWTLVAALGVVLLVAYVILLGALGVYDGLKDRALENREIARQHLARGLGYLEADEYELAVAELELALRHDASLAEARTRLEEAKRLSRLQVTPTSETRRDAAELLYRQAVAHYESGNLNQAVAVLDELRGLDVDFQRENVDTMLATAHHQLGLNAVAQTRMEDAAAHFEAVLAVDPEHEEAQDQLNLLSLYTAALSHWDKDWSAAIQALKGLYALAPEYVDVQTRLHDAYGFRAAARGAEGDWCRAADDYAAAVEVLPREVTVDNRDEARIRCQATAEAPTPSPTPRPGARPTSTPKADVQPSPTPTPTAAPIDSGQIAFTSYDAVRQRHDVYVVDLAQGAARLVRENASQPAFSPDGNRLIFHNHDPEHLGLGFLNLRRAEFQYLTDHVEDSMPAWSPDAAMILFSSNKHGDRKHRVYAISPGEIRGEGEEWAFGQAPAWSRDGDRVVYHGCDARGDRCGVWTMGAGGFEPARLTTDPSDTAPVWSPTADRVAFISARGGNWDLYVVNVATGQETRLTNSPAADVAPAWSPDGKRLAFLSNRGGGWAIHVLDLGSSQIEKIIATGDAYPNAQDEQLSWVP